MGVVLRRRFALAVLLTAGSLHGAAIQTADPPQGNGVIAGQVVDPRGAGIGAVLVKLDGGLEAAGSSIATTPLLGGARTTFTTADGRFVFFNLAAGRYSLQATKPGILPGAYGRQRPDGQAQSLVLHDNERRNQVAITMWPYGAIEGRIVDEIGDPLVGITVRALPRIIEAGRWRFDTATDTAQALGLQNTTDDRGEYRLDQLSPGDYIVAVPSTQHTMPVGLTGGGGAGTAGAPAVPSIQQQIASQIRSGDWALATSRSAISVPNPEPGGPLLVYPTTFFPATRSTADAEVIRIQAGETRPAVNIQMRLVPTTTVTGIVTGPQPHPRGMSVKVQPDYLSGLTTDRGFEIGVGSTDADGRFVILGVPTGQYSLAADVGIGTGGVQNPAHQDWVGRLRLTLGEGGARDLTLAMSRGVSVAGRIAFDGALPVPGPEALQRFSVRLDPADPFAMHVATAFRGTVDKTGSFQIKDVPPGRYVVKFGASAEDRRAMDGWESVGAMFNNRDVSTYPLVVQADVTGIVLTLSDKAGRLSGTARDANGRPDPAASVLLFTVDREIWKDAGSTNRRVRNVRAGEDGTFVISVVHAGEYFLLAIPDADARDWDDPARLDAFSRMATRVVFADHERKSLDVSTKTLPRAR